MNHKSSTSSSEHPDIEILDRWRSGLLSSPDAVSAHVAECKLCQQRSHFSVDLLQTWSAHPHPQTTARQLTAGRRQSPLWVGAAATCCLLLAAGFWHFAASPVNLATSTRNADSVPTEQQVVAHLSFYEWLNAHPDQLEQVADHG